MSHVPILFSLIQYFSLTIVLGKQFFIGAIFIILLVAIFKMIG